MKSKQNSATNHRFNSNFILIGISLTVYLVVVSFFFNVLFDDIFISLRYAKNLADGFGPTFSKGIPPVEGYSNSLLVWIVVLFIKLSIDPLLAVKLISILAGGATIILIVQLLNRLELSFIAKIAATTSLVFCIPYSYWIGSGTENGLYSLFLVAAIKMAIFNKRLGLGFLLIAVCLCLTRPEGVGFAFLIIGLRFLFARGENSWIEFSRNVIIFSLICMMLLAWRYATFGEFLPNTYYSKTGGSLLTNARNSVSILWLGFQAFGLPMTGLMIIGFFSCIKKRTLLIPLSVLAGGIAFVVYTGGDINIPRLRFFVLCIPIMSIFVGCGADLLSKWMPSRPFLLTILTLVILNFWHSYRTALPTYLNQTWRSGSTFKGHLALARSLHQKIPEGTTVAMWDIGIIPYELDHCRILDLTGITDSFISRTAGDHFSRNSKEVVDYVFKNNPELMILNTVKTRENSIFPEYPVINSIVSDNRFKKHYKPIHIQQTISPYHLIVFQRS
jgi:arabinofuranosyltransferase